MVVAAPREPGRPETVYEEFLQDILPYNLHTNHPRFWAWYMGSGTVMGAMAEFMAAALNPNCGGINHVAPLVEQQVIDWIVDMVGFPNESSGLLTSGASMANFTALAVARNTAGGFDVRREGLHRATGPLTVYASSEIHSCNQKAVETLGLGTDGLRKVAVNPDYTMNLDALERQVTEDRAAGMVPFCVIATAGTINTGAVDDMVAIADFCQREGLWFHVDGAYGYAYRLVPEWSLLFDGHELADSITWDPHKQLGVPIPNSLL